MPAFPETEENEVYTRLIPQDHTKMIPKTWEYFSRHRWTNTRQCLAMWV
jgi:hypothetical protein